MKALGNALSTSDNIILRKIAELCNKIAKNSKLLTNVNSLITNLKDITTSINKLKADKELIKYFIDYIIEIL